MLAWTRFDAGLRQSGSTRSPSGGPPRTTCGWSSADVPHLLHSGQAGRGRIATQSGPRHRAAGRLRLAEKWASAPPRRPGHGWRKPPRASSNGGSHAAGGELLQGQRHRFTPSPTSSSTSPGLYRKGSVDRDRHAQRPRHTWEDLRTGGAKLKAEEVRGGDRPGPTTTTPRASWRAIYGGSFGGSG